MGKKKPYQVWKLGIINGSQKLLQKTFRSRVTLQEVKITDNLNHF